MFSFLKNLFGTDGFPKRWECGPAWELEPAVGWMHIISDVVIFGAYTAIPLLLVFFVLRKKSAPFLPVFWLFAAFILACGFVHLIEASIFWYPRYRLSGLMKMFTAIVSVLTVGALVPLMPKFLAMRTPEELDKEINERKRAEAEAERANQAKGGLLKSWACGGCWLAQVLFLWRGDKILSTLLLDARSEIVFAPAIQMLHPATR